MKVEYLIVFNTEENVCTSIRTFKNLIQTDDSITVTNSVIKFETVEFSSKIGYGELNDKSQKFFLLEIIYEQTDDLSILQDLLKRIRTLLAKFGGEMTVLWDDIGINYALSSYPIICELENLLRKLISKFMITNIGTNWIKEALPNEVKEAATKNKRPNSNLLHNVDFINLADFLFKPYQTKLISTLYEKIKKCNNVEDLNLDDLKGFLPRSNWHRYFNSVVECDDDFLLKRWSKLYELRCLVAHNNFLSITEFNEIIKLTTEIKEPLLEAIDKLNQITIPEEEKEQIAENVAENLNEGVGHYISQWKVVEKEVSEAYEKLINKEKNLSVKRKIVALIEENHLTADFLIALQPLGEFRNLIVHGDLNANIDHENLTKKNSELGEFYMKFMFFEKPFF